MSRNTLRRQSPTLHLQSSRDSKEHVLPAIYTRIFSFLAGDMAALGNASLVCRDWLPLARAVLFRTLHVRAPSVKITHRMLIWQSRAARPGVGEHVEELVLAGASHAPHAKLSVGLLLQLVNALPRLRSITLEHLQLSWVAMHCAGAQTRIGRHRYLDSLSLADIRSPTRPCLAPLVLLFADIGTLRVRDFKDESAFSLACSKAGPTLERPEDGLVQSRIRALSIKGCGPLATMACMISLQDVIEPGSLKDIALAVPHMRVLPIFDDFVVAAAPTLERLDLNMLPLAAYPYPESPKNAFKCAPVPSPRTFMLPALVDLPSLRSLRFSMLLLVGPGDAGRDMHLLWFSLVNLVNGMRQHVRDIKLVLQVVGAYTWRGACIAMGPTSWENAAGWLGALDWRLLGDVFVGCPSLRSVSVRLVNGPRGFSRSTSYDCGKAELFWRYGVSEGGELQWLKTKMRAFLSHRIPQEVWNILSVV